jgi:hypothetical protein
MGREPLLMAAVGKKGVGKTWAHMITINKYVEGDPYHGIKGRKALVMDVNDEYGVFGIRALSLNDVGLFTVHPHVEVRRIRPFHPNGTRMTLDEWAQALFYVLSTFKNGLLVIEDPSKFIGDHMPSDLVGAIATNRHVGLDIILSYQSIGRIVTKLWGNLNQLRFHKNVESVERHKNKFPDKFEYMRIAEIMVNNQYDSGNKRFYCYVDMDESNIRGNYSQEMIEDAVEQYISENFRALTNPYLVLKDEKNKKKYNDNTARAEVKRRLLAQYIG